MASVADLCNMALSHIGARAQVASIDPPDGTAEAGYCARFYPIARREMLESHAWSFAKTRAVLASVDLPDTSWLYAYALPSDCLNIVRVMRNPATSTNTLTGALPSFVPAADTAVSNVGLFAERIRRDYEVESGVLLCNEPDALIVYIRDVTDTAKFPAQFNVALSYLLASYIAGPIIKGIDGAQLAGNFRKVAAQVKGDSSATDADSSGTAEANEYIPESILSRQ